MSTNEMSLFFFMLACFGVLVLVTALVLGALRLVKGELVGPARDLADRVIPLAPILSFVAATTAMLGSLYYSEVAGFDPCRMCWYQRYAMYPAAIILGLALATKKRFFTVIALALSLVGIAISTYHRAEQAYPSAVGSSCSLDNPCSSRYVNLFGAITIPTMTWVAFAFVILFTLVTLFSRGGNVPSGPKS